MSDQSLRKKMENLSFKETPTSSEVRPSSSDCSEYGDYFGITTSQYRSLESQQTPQRNSSTDQTDELPASPRDSQRRRLRN